MTFKDTDDCDDCPLSRLLVLCTVNVISLYRACVIISSTHKTLNQCCFTIGPPSTTLVQRWSSTDSTSCVLLGYLFALADHSSCFPANTLRWNNDVLMLGQRRRRWANIKTSLFQRVVFAGLPLFPEVHLAVPSLIVYIPNSPGTKLNQRLWIVSGYWVIL